MTFVLELEKLDLAVNGQTLLQSQHHTVTTNSLAVLGLNGSGKTLFTRLVAGLIAPSAGAARINGVDLSKDRELALREIGILFQNPESQIVFPTVIDELVFGLKNIGHTDAEAYALSIESLRNFGIEGWENKSTFQLSFGQKHILCLVAVLLMKPKVIILDETFVGMDSVNRARMERFLQGYNGGFIKVSHHYGDLASCDDAIWIEGGSVKACGPFDQIYPLYEASTYEIISNDCS